VCVCVCVCVFVCVCVWVCACVCVCVWSPGAEDPEHTTTEVKISTVFFLAARYCFVFHPQFPQFTAKPKARQCLLDAHAPTASTCPSR
jgi:hypothetical protein